MRPTLTRSAMALAALVVLAAAGAAPLYAIGTPAGTVISNQATVDYTDSNGNTLQTLSNIVTTVVSQAASVTVNPDRVANAAPGDIIYYAHVVTNGGNGNDTIDLTAVSSNGWTTALFVDADGSGTFTAGDTLLIDTDGDLVPDTGSLAADGFLEILARVTVPAGAANGTVDTMTVTGTSTFNTAVVDSSVDITTISASVLTAVKSVLPAGPQTPGTVLTYSLVVTNNGTGNADNIVLTDPIPANTTFVAGSLVLGGVSKTDAGLDDEADFNATTANAVTFNVGTLAPAGTVTVTFQVTIN